MNRFWEIYEELDGFVYVTKIETNELVYMNRRVRELCGISDDSYIGKPCFKILQNKDDVCSICNNHRLQPNKFEQWKFFNDQLNVFVQIIDTIVEEDGVKYRLEIAFDISSKKNEYEEIEVLRRSEKICNDGIKYALEYDNPIDCINRILEYIGKCLFADRTYIFEKDERDYDVNTYEWCAEYVTPQMENLNNLPPDVCRPWYKKFINEGIVIIPDIELIKESDPKVYSVLKPQNIHSLVSVPIRMQDRIVGFFGIDNPLKEYFNLSSEILEIMSNFIAALFRRRELFEKLCKLSFTDKLTGLGNRHALYNYLDSDIDYNSLALFYCDLNGLKAANDTFGHAEGDRLIINACNVIKKVFSNGHCFRIGGDEFIVFVSNVSPSDVNSKEAEFKKELDDNGVSMALGINWSENPSDGMEQFIRQAEQRMYDDKRRIYEYTGNDRRNS